VSKDGLFEGRAVTWVPTPAVFTSHVAGFRFGYYCNKANNITCSFSDVCDYVMVIRLTGYQRFLKQINSGPREASVRSYHHD
jgi:hypothetical protein